jgi:Spy/CpxP family protein refolding chaperone
VLERIGDDSNLSETEKAKVDEILEAHEEKMRKARDEARTVLLEQMKEVLTDKQYAQFKQKVDRRPLLRHAVAEPVEVEEHLGHVACRSIRSSTMS